MHDIIYYARYHLLRKIHSLRQARMRISQDQESCVVHTISHLVYNWMFNLTIFTNQQINKVYYILLSGQGAKLGQPKVFCGNEEASSTSKNLVSCCSNWSGCTGGGDFKGVVDWCNDFEWSWSASSHWMWALSFFSNASSLLVISHGSKSAICFLGSCKDLWKCVVWDVLVFFHLELSFPLIPWIKTWLTFGMCQAFGVDLMQNPSCLLIGTWHSFSTTVVTFTWEASSELSCWLISSRVIQVLK